MGNEQGWQGSGSTQRNQETFATNIYVTSTQSPPFWDSSFSSLEPASQGGCVQILPIPSVPGSWWEGPQWEGCLCGPYSPQRQR